MNNFALIVREEMIAILNEVDHHVKEMITLSEEE
jgi:hypothetical protein